MMKSKLQETNVKDFSQVADLCKSYYFVNIFLYSIRLQTVMNKLQKVEVLQPQTGDGIRNFSNPVCKQTFYSLPKIYGSKKKKSRLDTSPPQKTTYAPVQSRSKPRRHFSSYQIQSQSKTRKSINQSKLLGSTTHVQGCSKKNCSCHSIDNNMSRKTTKKFMSTHARQMMLPQIKKFDLQDLQSQHKVSLQGITTKTNFRPSGLDRIIQQNQKIRSKNDSPKNMDENQQSKKQLIRQHQSLNMPKTNLNVMKNKYKVKPKINNARFEIEQQSDEQKNTEQNYADDSTLPNHNNKIKRNQSARYKTEANASESPDSVNSKSLSTFLIKGAKRTNTNFYELNISEKSMERKILNRKPSQLSNGLFRIPQQQQYADYLRGYKSVNQNFNIKKIARRPGFKVEKNNNGVFFGQFDNQLRRHGEGVSVTEKEIFQGRYQRNVKTSGCERNIDGVYIGQFKNGLRSGHGVFRWNNGEVFEGQWQNGMKNGFGTWRSPKGDFYEGQWSLNRQHGQGFFRHRSSTYKGQFKNFLKDGMGTQDFINGDRYQGEYKEGKPHGRGRYEWHKGSYYEGQFNMGMREGRGKWVDQEGTTYEGYFKADFKHGFGKQIYKNGEVYEGQFQQGKRVTENEKNQGSKKFPSRR